MLYARNAALLRNECALVWHRENRQRAYQRFVADFMKRFVLLFLSAMLSACASSPPKLNESSASKLAISGTIDPQMSAMFRILYVAKNKRCDQWGGAGPNVPLSRTETRLVPYGTHSFSLVFDLDKYLPGACEWQPVYVDVRFAAFDRLAEEGLVYKFMDISQAYGVTNPDTTVVHCRQRTRTRPLLLLCNVPLRGLSPALSPRGTAMNVNISLEVEQ